MRWQRPLANGRTLIRPMLKTDKNMVLDFLKQINQNWCEDQSNQDQSRLRARLRQTVIPELLDIRADLPSQIVTTTDQLHAVDTYIDSEVEKAIKTCLVEPQIANALAQYQRAKLKSLHPTLLNYVLRQILIEVGAKIDSLNAKQLEQFAMMLSDVDGSTRHLDFGNHIQIRLTKTTLTVTQIA
ncbi:MAG: hypothetical protein KUG81_04830, partial [Gammaproteobacteria bacterium]|nr:hypothetical protein [Gammaproteobacteria bacterium]